MRKLVLLSLVGLVLACNDSVIVEPLDDSTVAAPDHVPANKILASDDFESGNADGWNLWGVNDWMWTVQNEDGNYVLSSSTGSGFSFATLRHPGWYDYRFRSRLKFVSGNIYCELLFRIDYSYQHYWLQVTEGSIGLHREGTTGAFVELARRDMEILRNEWYDFEIVAKGKKIKVYVNGSKIMNVKDDHAWGNAGTVGFEVHDDTQVYFDDVMVIRK